MEDFMELKEVSTREEIFNLPYYLTENGRKRYMEVFDEERRYKIFDEYGRMIEDYWYGFWKKYIYNDRKHTTTIVYHNAENCDISKHTRKMNEFEYIKKHKKTKN